MFETKNMTVTSITFQRTINSKILDRTCDPDVTQK